MCYDISFSTNYELISRYIPDLLVDPQIDFDLSGPVHMMAQSFSKKGVVFREDGKNHLKNFEWGVIADYMKTPEQVKKSRQWMCNAQSEKVLDHKAYWYRIRRKRCIIPVDGFFEHREVKGWKNKIPYYIHLKDRPLFSLIGLYTYAPVPNVETGEVRGTFTVLTRKANALMEQIHNGGPNHGRMPLLLPKDLEMEWLREDLEDQDIEKILRYEMQPEAMDAHPVYTIRTTKDRPDGKTKTDLYEWPNLPPLGVDSSELSLF